MLARLSKAAAIGVGALVAVLGAFSVPLTAGEPSPEDLKFFESQVRPLLAENCFKCHGPDKQRGGLRLDSLAAILAGGDSGPAIVPGKAGESLLVEAVNYASYEMPPTGKLADDQIAILTHWVQRGAPWPDAHDSAPPRPGGKEKITDEDRAFWSFQPVRQPPVPEVDDAGWSRNEIDRFIYQRLAAAGLSPAPEAERAALVRRLYFDLIGLPPTPAELEAFLADPSPDAYERLVDRLLESPRYGERWARHWLDLVRYAESDGFRQDAYRPYAWPYRDYVIRAFNNDKPYDQFVLEQLAGDEIAPHDPDALAATGLLRHWTYEYNQRDARTQWDNILDDLTDVTSDVFLGLGMGCARCHDHKFDPVLQKDYYALRAFFAAIVPRDDLPLATADEVAEHRAKQAEWEAATAELWAEIEAIRRPHLERAAKGAIDKFPADIQEIARKPAAERTPLEHQLYDLVHRQVLVEYEKVDGQIKGEEKERLEALQKKLAEFDMLKPPALPPAFTVRDVGTAASPMFIPGAGRQEPIEPAFLTVLGGEQPEIDPLTHLNSTGRRTALARWLTRPDHPLTARVIVNRVWQQHFGRGLVGTPSDFGRLGERPSHPELLDWLAARFVAGGWRFKPLDRLIVTSATYRQSALGTEAARKHDPENRLLARSSSRRLEAEQIRDAMLAVCGELDPAMGGPGVDPSQPRRSIYTKAIRNTRDPLLDVFDLPDGFTSTATRNVTTTPTQSLLLINGPWTLKRAQAWAARLEQVGLADDEELVVAAYRQALARAPSDEELSAAVDFLKDQASRVAEGTDPAAARRAALVDFCHALLNSSEFLYVD